MYVAELFTGGLPPSELAKRAQRVRGPKQICKGAGCITPISAYNLDAEGTPEKLCYRCQGLKDEPVNISRDGTARRPITCKKNHDLTEVGIKNGKCVQCQQEYDRERWRKKADTLRKSAYPRESYLVLHGLAGLMEARGIKSPSLEKAVDIPHRSLRGYALDGVGCPPDRAMKIANYFGVSVEELCNQDQEVAM